MITVFGSAPDFALVYTLLWQNLTILGAIMPTGEGSPPTPPPHTNPPLAVGGRVRTSTCPRVAPAVPRSTNEPGERTKGFRMVFPLFPPYPRPLLAGIISAWLHFVATRVALVTRDVSLGLCPGLRFRPFWGSAKVPSATSATPVILYGAPYK